MPMKIIGSYELRTKLSEILRRVQTGEAFTVTSRGKPVADLVPSSSASRRKIAAAVSDIKAGMSKTAVSDKRLKEYMEHGRK